MGNICATERNKECLLVVKSPKSMVSQFDNCVLYSKRTNMKKDLIKKKNKLMRKVNSIEQRLSDGDY